MYCGQIITLSCGGTDSDFFGRILLMDNISAGVLYPPNPNLQHLNTRREFRFRESSLAPKDKRDAIHREIDSIVRHKDLSGSQPRSMGGWVQTRGDGRTRQTVSTGPGGIHFFGEKV